MPLVVSRKFLSKSEKEGRIEEKQEEPRPPWLPPDLDPVLEELPKWNLLGEVLREVEGEVRRFESAGRGGSHFLVLGFSFACLVLCV